MHDWIVVLGAETPSGQAIAKKLRAEHYCCRLMASDIGLTEVMDESPAGVILVGEESEGAFTPSVDFLSQNIPVLAIGSVARSLCATLGERCEGEGIVRSVEQVKYMNTPLFDEVGGAERWIDRAEPFALPEPYRVIAEGEQFPLAFANDEANVYLLQFQIERNDPDGMSILLSFADEVCGCTPWWTSENILQIAEKTIRDGVGDGSAICAMSGGLDSTVAAVIAKRVLKDRLTCVLVDTGLLREGETESVEQYLRNDLSLPLTRVDVSAKILQSLKGLTAVSDKRKVIEREIFLALEAQDHSEGQEKVLIKGTNFVDVLGGTKEAEDETGSKTVEPMLELFKEEIRMLGEYLSLAPFVINRQPFPGMGLAARIYGEVNAERLQILRRADRIFSDELVEVGLHKKMKRYFAVLNTGKGWNQIILRAMHGDGPAMNAARLPYDLLERTVERIHQELPSVERVLYDLTPGVADWL